VHERAAQSIEHAQQLSRTRYCWIITYLADYSSWDWLYEPPPWQAHQRHAWASQWQQDSGTYLVPKQGYTDTNYHQFPILQRQSNRAVWDVPTGVDTQGFDFSWHPDPTEPPYIYQFGTQWQKIGGPKYVVPGAVETKYISSPRAEKTAVDPYWEVPQGIDVNSFDWTWHPDPTEPAYIYQFGTQWQKTGGPKYVVPGAVETKYISSPRAEKTAVDPYWTMPDNMNKEAFDWTWHPDPTEPAYIYQFGTQWNRAGGPEYTVPGAREIKFISTQVARMLPTDLNWIVPQGIDVNSFDFSWTPDPTEPAYIYEFGTQWQKTGGPKYVVPGAVETKYISSPRAEKTAVDPYWEVPHGADVNSFDWTWHPDDTEEFYIYQFGTQHQRTGGPRYVKPGARNVKYIDQIKIRTQRTAVVVYLIDHMDGNVGKVTQQIHAHLPVYKTVRYFDNYLDTLKRIAKNAPDDQEFIWICSSICDYSKFDFSWHPEQWQVGMLHVFASDGEKFGDTFFMHVPTFQYRADTCQLLEWYDLNFIEDVSIPRKPMPVIQHQDDCHVNAIKTHEWSGPLALFVIDQTTVNNIPTIPLWREKTKTVVPLGRGASAVVVPRVAIPYIRTQAYDYSWIDKTHIDDIKELPLDIIFISNGEVNAEENYQHLKSVTATSQNRVVRVDGVNGRVAAYHAALTASHTRWAFCVFAKLKVNPDFNWSWQPDRMQQAKHYIFHATNPINGLTYGHQAIIAYNKRLVLANAGHGLDFTLDDEHEVVPIVSGVADYALTKWSAWRTAFRECIKLCVQQNVESQYRLKKWHTMTGDNPNGQWSVYGAEDAVAYYESYKDNFDELKKSYEWSWLANHALSKRNLTTDQ